MTFARQLVEVELQAGACRQVPGAGRLVLGVAEVYRLVPGAEQGQQVGKQVPEEVSKGLTALDQASKLGSKRGHQDLASEAPSANPSPSYSTTKPVEHQNYQVVRLELY